MNLQSGEVRATTIPEILGTTDTTPQYSTQKGICEDLDEGKISYLVVHCLTTRPEFKDHVLGLFRLLASTSMPMQQEHKQHILGCMEATGTFDHTLKVLTSLEESINQEIGRLEQATGEKNPLLRLLVTRLSVVDLKKGRG